MLRTKMVHPLARFCLGVVLATGCSSNNNNALEKVTPEPPAPASARGATDASPPPRIMPKKDEAQEVAQHEAQKVELVQDKAVEIDGITLILKGAGYAHASGDRNFSDAMLEVRRGGEVSNLSLGRQHPGELEYVPLFDRHEIALDVADAYGVRSSAVVLVRAKTE